MNTHAMSFDRLHISARRRSRLALTGLVLLTVLAGCRSDAGDEQHGGPPPAPQVSVAEVVTREIRPWDEFTGRVEAVETVDIRPRVSGYIEEVRYTEGAEVEKGDVLFVIDQRPYRAELARADAELARARAQFELARTEMARARKLLESRAISQEEHDQRIAANAQTLAGVGAAEAALEVARLNVAFTEVRSPISGRTGRAMVTAGNLVTSGETVLTTVVSLDPVHVYFEGDEQLYLRHRDVQGNGSDSSENRSSVFVGLSQEQGFPHEGYLDFVDNQVNPNTGTLSGRAVVPNPDRLFTPGSFARVKLLGNGAFDALLVDDRAILTDQDRRYVYVIDENNLAQRRDVHLGRTVDGLRIVTEGLAEGDRVIVHGMQKVFFPGMPVNPQVISMGDPPPAPGTPPAEAAQSDTGEQPQS